VISPLGQGEEGQPISVDDSIDELARQALAEARRREELQRALERDQPRGKASC
jgi:hypothetical protein